MAVLLVCATEGPTITVDKPIVLVGRHPDCDVRLDSQKVSRRHCCIAQVNGDVIVRDLGSTNGIRINGQVVQECRLKPGDELAIGNVRFRVERDDNERAKSQASRAQERARAPGHDPGAISSDVPILLPDDEDLEQVAPEIRTLKPREDESFPVTPPSSDEIQFAPSDHGSEAN
jgi:pSer/pThr/pTyr-binding forkhead associated (FHA) protein